MYCVYVMSSVDNKHVYVGSTKNLKSRSWKHMNDCKHGRHQHKVQALFNLIGKIGFEFDVLSEHATKAEALEYEQAWVDYYKAHPTVWNLLNVATEDVKAAACNDDVKAKISAAHRGRKRSSAHKAKLASASSKPVYVKWADGREITYPTRRDAAKAIGCSESSSLLPWLKGESTTFYKRGIDEVRWA